MKILSYIKTNILYSACFYTVLFCLFLFLVTGFSNSIQALVSNVFYAIFAYSVLIALSNGILHFKHWNSVVRRLLHFAINAILFFLFMKIIFYIYEKILQQTMDQQEKMMILAMIVFLVLYLLLTALSLVCGAIKNKLTAKAAQDYQNQF